MFPFRLATTSYIIPAAIIPNLLFLGPHVDEVELVLFESGDESNLPSKAEILEMRRLAGDLDLTYNVHLPADVFLGDPDRGLRKDFRNTILQFYERTLPLEPEVFILHLDSRWADGRKDPDWNAWTDRVCESLESLVDGGLASHRVSVENLEYPLEIILPIVESFGMSLCLDLGHFLRYGYDLGAQIDSYLAKSCMVHLHGVRDGVDHLTAEWIPQSEWELIGQALKGYSRGVSIEVFTVGDLVSSLSRLQDLFDHPL